MTWSLDASRRSQLLALIALEASTVTVRKILLTFDDPVRRRLATAVIGFTFLRVWAGDSRLGDCARVQRQLSLWSTCSNSLLPEEDEVNARDSGVRSHMFEG